MTGADAGADGPADPDDGSWTTTHRDEMSEIEAEADAQRSDLDQLAGLGPKGDPDRRRANAGTVRPGDIVSAGPAPNHRIGRQRFLVVYLRVALVLAFLVGVVELVIPDEHRDRAGMVMVIVFVVAPAGRVLWLMVRWLRLGDWRFALIGLTLLAVVCTGLIVK